MFERVYEGEQEVEALKAELAAEQARKFEMEVERSEMQRRLQQTDDLQKELDSYRWPDVPLGCGVELCLQC